MAVRGRSQARRRASRPPWAIGDLAPVCRLGLPGALAHASGPVQPLWPGAAAGPPDVDRPGGIVTELVNPEGTAAAILRLLRAPSLRRAMGEALRDRVVKDYDRRAIIAEYRHIYSMLGAQARFSELQ